MKKVLYIVIPVMLFAIVVIRLMNNKETARQQVYQYNKEEAVNVNADTLLMADIDADYSFSGTFEPNKETKLSAEIQGKINCILVDAGSNVKNGQPLLQLDNSLLKLQLQSVEVQIEGLEADVKRYTILTNADAVQGALLEKAELGLKSAKVQRSSLLEQINKTTITAPFEGVVTAKLTEVGAFAAPGVPLLQITDIAQLKFTVTVPETDLNLFNANISYNVVADAFPAIVLSGKATLIGSRANVAGSFPVQIAIQNTPDLTIKAGMFGKVLLAERKGGKRMIIPASAIVGSSVHPQLYLVENGKAALKDITVSTRAKNKAVVSAGLKEGDVMITGGFINLFNGANVTVK
ncbi:MAG: efflux RND transporter periplasmic adaptor subunit [Bacteroidetes bacterium]|nr:efflux RND transporter periplasmic adaptor subunit [Bacteroidota bacterium]